VGENVSQRGASTLGNLAAPLRNADSTQALVAKDVMCADLPILTEDDRLSEAICRWSQVSLDRLPVVDSLETRRLVGELSAGDIMALYSQELLHKEARLARFDRPRAGHRL